MGNRWGVVAVLFTVRLTMAFQFQSVAAVAPLLGPKFDVSLADIGLLIGLYFTPGVALALPGGAIGQRFDDKVTVLAALTLMLVGGLLMAVSDLWGVQIAGRLIAGGGGVLLNVQMSKMVTDQFAGKEIATAMAIFANSWPAGVDRSLSRGRRRGRARHPAARRDLSAAGASCGSRNLGAAGPPHDRRRHGRRPDLGAVQRRFRHDFQFRAIAPGRACVVDDGSRIGDQHRFVACGCFRALGRNAG